jgi:predicted TPR repeat methyltransferase
MQSHPPSAMSTTHASTQALFDRAVQLHQSGQWQEARPLYENVLQAQPRHANALHMLGMLEIRQKNHLRAIELLTQAIAIDPQHPLYHLTLGNALQENQQSELALSSYSQAAALKPDFVEAYFNSAHALHTQERWSEALDFYNQAIALRPQYPQAYSNRGLVQQALKQTEAALASYNTAIAQNSRYATAYSNRGNALKDLRQLEAALASYNQAIALKPDFAEAYTNRGIVLGMLGHQEAAQSSYHSAIGVQPHYADAHYHLGQLWQEQGQTETAAASFHRALAADANHQLARYALAALGKAPAPAAAPAHYVASLFDNYADQFDAHLSQTLQYNTPALLAAQFTRYAQAGKRYALLDLGCGTGLAGVAFQSMVHPMDGVDLSANMLDKARERRLYEDLACSEIGAYLLQTSKKYDLVLAADVLVYIGALEALFSGVQGVLHPGGFFAFSVESSQAQTYELKQSKRYGHAVAYVQSLARNYGFAVVDMQTDTLRKERHTPVKGHIVLLQKADV